MTPRQPARRLYRRAVLSAVSRAVCNFASFIFRFCTAADVQKKDEIWRTGHIDSTLEPQWGTPPGSGETFSFPIEELRPKTASADEEYHDRSKYKTYRLDVMDYNKMTKEVFLGAVYLSPEHYHCEEGEERQEDYEWELEAHDVRSAKENKLAKGKLSFSIRFVYK